MTTENIVGKYTIYMKIGRIFHFIKVFLVQKWHNSIDKDSIALPEEDIVRRCEVETSVGAAVPAADVSVRAEPADNVAGNHKQ